MSDKIPTPAEAEDQIGYPINWAYGGTGYNFVPELDGPNGLLRLQKMAETDETVGAMLFVMTSTLSQLNYAHTPCVDGKEVSNTDDDFEEASKWAAFADTCIHDMANTFPDHIEEALTMVWAGFAPCEISFKKRDGEGSGYDDGRWGYEGITLRDQHTIMEFVNDERQNPIAAVQVTAEGGRAEIPLWKMCNYRASSVLNNPWGRSMLKNAYRPWYLKQRIQESEAVGIDRELCGMPTMRIPMSDLNLANEKDANGVLTEKAKAARGRIQAAVDASTKLRYNQAAGLVLPSDPYRDDDGKISTMLKWDFSIVSSSGQRSIDARTAARDYDRAIARTILMQFLHLGDRSGGSYGLSEDQSSIAIRSLKSISLKICGEYNKKALKLLWLMNALPKKYMPKLEAGEVSEESIEQIGLFLQRVADAEPLFLDDPAMKDSVLARAGLRQARRKMKDKPAQPRSAQPELPLSGRDPANARKQPAAASG